MSLDVGAAGNWDYDLAGRLYAIPGYIDSIDYEADGQTKKIVYANGVYTRFYYSAARRWLISLATRNATGAYFTGGTYTRDGEADERLIQ